MAPDRYAVIGHHIGYSRSPRIHAAFAQACGQALEYGLLDIEPASFEESVRGFFAGGGRGLNITVPFKERACALADQRSGRASEAGAANTLARLPDGRVLADNTDGAGLVRDLVGNLGCRLAGARVLLAGAGGAALGVAGPLLRAGVARLEVCNRTGARAQALAHRFAAVGPVQAVEAGASGPPYDLVVNATSASRAGELPALPAGAAGPGTLCYDMGYALGETAFGRWALAAGARHADGLGMLVEQAAESFLLWRGLRPPTAEVLARLRAE